MLLLLTQLDAALMHDAALLLALARQLAMLQEPSGNA